MRIKLPVLTETLCLAGAEQQQAIEAGNEVGTLVEAYRREMTRMMEQIEQRLSRQISEETGRIRQELGQTLARMDEHFIHFGEVQLEQHKMQQELASGLFELNKRQGRMEKDISTLNQRQDRMEGDISDLKQGQAVMQEDFKGMSNKLDLLLERV